MDFKSGDEVDFKNNKAQAEYFLSMKVAEQVFVSDEKKDVVKDKKDKK
jgi:hypothetical protein